MNTTMQAGAAGRSGPALVIRINGLLFHAVAMASLMESASALYTYRLLPALDAYPALCAWVEKSWWPTKCARGRAFRDYVAAVWPEFDWPAAFDHYYLTQRAMSCIDTPAAAPQSLLRHVVIAAQCAAFYRALAGWADDPQLRALAAAAAAEEADAFNRFRSAYELAGMPGKPGAWGSLRSALQTIRGVAHHPVRDAYVAVATVHQAAGTPGAMTGYAEFVRRMLPVIERQARLGLIHRMLLKPWRQLARSAGVATVAPAYAVARREPQGAGRPFAGLRALG